MESQPIILDKLPQCSCGCGNQVKRLGLMFVHGHHRRGILMTQEQKEKISLANKGRIMTTEQIRVNSEVHLGVSSGMKGKHHSDETKEKLKNASTGRVCSDETRNKLSECKKGRLVSDETRNKLSKAFKGRKLSTEHCESLRLSHLGKPSLLKGIPRSSEVKKKLSTANKGRIMPEDVRQKMSLSKMGHNVSEDTRIKISLSNVGKISPMKGKFHSIDTKKKMRLSAIDRISSQAFGGLPKMPRIGIIESEVVDKLQSVCPYRIARQYQVCGYFLDGYIPELNIAIEFDEAKHRLKTERDMTRQLEIEKELGCLFFRITPTQWKEKNNVLEGFTKHLKAFDPETGIADYNIR